jgi:tRNA(fMet)-specific endonuclease VapC
LFELWYGVAKSGQVQENTERLRVLLSGDLDLLDFDDEDAQAADRIRAA